MTRQYPRLVKFGSGVLDEVPSSDFGNKAAGLATMTALGIPVPPGFSLNVSVCEEYYQNHEQLPGDFGDLLTNGIVFLENATGYGFGSTRRPLLISVRSGAPVSMPGVMDTLLNVGLNRDTLRGLIFLSGNPKFAWDSYRRLMVNFTEIIFRQDPRPYRALLEEKMQKEGIPDEVELDAGSIRDLVAEYDRLFSATTGRKFPSDVREQLELAATGVLQSWMNSRAEAFRKMNLIGDARGTAITVQAMVFGNMGLMSGAGVAFSRNPWLGENEILVDFKFGAQGEDVVSGEQAASTQAELLKAMPEVYGELKKICHRLENHYRDMQDLEFTVQEGTLFILQTRPGKRSPYAALKIAVSLCREGIISPSDVIWMLRDIDIDHISIRTVKSRDYPVAIGVPASAGVASGRIALSGERVERDVAEGMEAILVRETASPDDLPGIAAAIGLLTARGARTSHAAVVARQMGKVCVVDCTGLEIDQARQRCNIGGHELREGTTISIDGNSGKVYLGEVEYGEERPVDLIEMVRTWERTMQV